jgi:hypothetical protein
MTSGTQDEGVWSIPQWLVDRLAAALRELIIADRASRVARDRPSRASVRK